MPDEKETTGTVTVTAREANVTTPEPEKKDLPVREANDKSPAPSETPDGGKRDEIDVLRDKYKKANEEDARLRKLNETLAKERDAKDEELQKLQQALAEKDAQVGEIESRYQRKVLESQIKVVAVTMGFHDPDDVLQLVDYSKIVTDKTGKVKGIDEAVDAVAKAKPYLLKNGRPSAPDIDANRGRPRQPEVAEQEEKVKRRFGLS